MQAHCHARPMNSEAWLSLGLIRALACSEHTEDPVSVLQTSSDDISHVLVPLLRGQSSLISEL